MPKHFRPMTPGTRQLVLNSRDALTEHAPKAQDLQWKGPYKPLLAKKKRCSGRNSDGRITCRHRGGGHKRHYRLVDFKRDKLEIPARVASVEYDPNRTCFIALLNYEDGEKRYIIAPKDLKVGDIVKTTETSPFRIGNCMKLKDMPIGSVVHNIEMKPGKGGIFVRSAGLSASLMARSGGYATLKMPSGEVRMVLDECRATLGEVSNAERALRVESKAGRMRWKGIRPTVRGTAMNPVDHPHGGGEGKHNGYIPQTPWGMQTKGFKTRTKSKSTKFIVKDRRK